VRVDAADDCSALLAALDRLGCWATVKECLTRDLCDAIATPPASRWRSVDWGVDGRVERQVAEVDFTRASWGEHAAKVRVVAVRLRERDNGKRVYLWNHLDFSVQAFLTNDAFSDGGDVAQRRDALAGIEPLIGEWKGAWGIGEVSSRGFDAIHATLLLKRLTHNLLRRYVLRAAPALCSGGEHRGCAERCWRCPVGWCARAGAGRCAWCPRPMLN
jgi:hypothetical protein